MALGDDRVEADDAADRAALIAPRHVPRGDPAAARLAGELVADIARRGRLAAERPGQVRGHVGVAQEVEHVGRGPAQRGAAADAGESLHDGVPGHDDQRAIGHDDRVLEALDEARAQRIQRPVSIATLRGRNPPRMTRPLASPLLSMASTRIPMGLRGLRILVIEDAQDIREVFTLLLRAEGADVDSAANGREATELVAQQRFDVVLSDLGLPDIPGDVLIRELRARSGRATRVMVVTGYGEPFLTRARQAGADVVFTKPVEWSRILEYIERSDLAASA